MYKRQVEASPDADTFGRARAGSLREDISHQNFRVAVDIVEADAALRQDFGILARVSTPGLGTLNGYSATFDTTADRLYLSRVDDEDGTTLNNDVLVIEDGKSYRLVFHGYEERFLVEVFEVENLNSPIVSIAGTDDAHEEGSTGIFGFAALAEGTVDVTFDNFVAGGNPDVDQDGMSDPDEAEAFGDLNQTGEDDFDADGVSNAIELQVGTDPTVPDTEVNVTDFWVSPDLLNVSFLLVAGRSFVLETSSDLDTWIVDEDALMIDNGNGLAQLQTARSEERKFFRVRMSK